MEIFLRKGFRKFILILLGVEDGSYDITEDQITAPDEDIAASDNEEVCSLFIGQRCD